MLVEFIEGVRAENRGRTPPAQARFQAPGLPTLGTQVAQFAHDFDRQETRPGNKQDFVELVKLGETLHPEEGTGHCLLLTDVPPMLEPLEALLLLAEYSHRPGPAFAWNVRQADYLMEMGAVLGLDQPLTFGAVCIAHPLRFDRDLADRYARMLKQGQQAGLCAMPVAGLTTPVTVEGFMVVASAELLASWIVGRALNPRVSLGGSIWPGTPDMKTGHVSFSACDALFYAFATVQFLERWCGVRVAVGGGEYCSAQQPGLYAALEKAYKAMAIAAFTGEHPSVGGGMLDSGKVLSDVQLLLERELGLGLRHYAREIVAEEDRIGLPTILDIGIGQHAEYLWAEHTARYFRQSLWLPDLLERTGWTSFDDEARLLRRARDKAKTLTADYRKPEGREDQLAQMGAVLERARRELL
jgi:trimethylamine:corrinoid methyltransferase-like protein